MIKNIAYLLLGIITLGALFIIFLTNGTGDSGDSITHFIISRDAIKFPAYYLDQWNKPVFTLLSSPFAYFGFKWMKIYNLLMSVLTALITLKIAKILKKDNYWLVVLFIFLSPYFFVLIFSGLTEYTFAFFLMLMVLLYLEKKYFFAFLVLSFLPFVRSEGLVVICTLAPLFIFKKQFAYLPVLLLGHLAIGIAGAIHSKDILWLFTAMPYGTLQPKYGSGEWYHFIYQLYFVVHLPIYILVVTGYIYKAVKKCGQLLDIKNLLVDEEMWLIYGLALGYFVAHSIFWRFGIFGSFGMKRVLIAIVPLLSLIALDGVNFLLSYIPKFRHWAMVIVVMSMLYFPLRGFPSCFPGTDWPDATNWGKDFYLDAQQALAEKVTAKYGNRQDHIFYYDHPHFGLSLKWLDHFDNGQHKWLRQIREEKGVQDNAIVIWDFWYSVTEAKISLEELRSIKELTELEEFVSEQDSSIRMVVFEKK